MLPNHAPLVVAEQFGTLEALYPGRIDLGIGRAPGTDQRTALRAAAPAGGCQPTIFPQLLPSCTASSSGRARRRLPRDPRHARLWRRPAGDLAARLERVQRPGRRCAGAAVLPSPTTSAPHNTVPALDLYREHFRPSEILDKPYAMVTAMVVCAPDDDEANLLASAIALSFARMRSGYPPARLPTVADIEAHEWTPQERAFVESWLAPQVIGSPETVRRRMTELLAETGVAEFMATTNAPSATARTRSYQLLAELAELPRG